VAIVGALYRRHMTGTLFVVGTPIGNLGDLSERARTTLARVDLIAAEDTRRTGRLLQTLDVHAKLVSFFEGNEERRVGEIVAALREDHDVALVSDAGMPGISDPGFRLVRACAEEGIAVHVVPGPSAVLAALVVSGLPTDRFVFEGFLPRRAGERRERLDALASDPRTIVLFESPARLVAHLKELREWFGDRRIAVARELTKLHEETIRGTISDVLGRLGDGPVRGEVVVVVEGAAPTAGSVEDAVDDARSLVEGGMRKREAAAEVARRHGVSANEVYRALVG
jgi:16S rRNA (cytidine1402-2'-O)-methyltransferase